MADLCYSVVPKDLQGNLAFRRWVMKTAKESTAFREDFLCACSRDILFFVNAACWTNNAKRADCPHIPWITYPKQDEFLLALEVSWGKESLAINKSRQMGASWGMIVVIAHKCRFRDGQKVLLISRNQTYVDQLGNQKCLFYKLDYIEDHLPWFVRVPVDRKMNHFHYELTGSTVNGETTTGDVARGDTRTVIMLDELQAFGALDGMNALASTDPASHCKWYNGTPSGRGNAFYQVHNERPSLKKIVLDWKDWPAQAAGLYTSVGGAVKKLDPDYEYPEGYSFVCDGKTRSPWYDAATRDRPKMIVAQEYDHDFLASGSPLLEEAEINKIIGQSVREPVLCGEFVLGKEGKVSFAPSSKGRWRLWCGLDAWGSPPRDRKYVIGADIAAGTGASNSVLAVGDARTGEKVAEFASSRVRPDELADEVLKCGRFFADSFGIAAYLIWEARGTGRIFGDRVMRSGYGNIYYARSEQKLTGAKVSDTPGWQPNPENQKTMLLEYATACLSADFIERSAEAVDELRLYVWQDGDIVFCGDTAILDPSGAKDNHGDRVVAGGLCWKGIVELRGFVKRKDEDQDGYTLENPPPGTAEWQARQYEMYEKQRRGKADQAEYWMAGLK